MRLDEREKEKAKKQKADASDDVEVIDGSENAESAEATEQFIPSTAKLVQACLTGKCDDIPVDITDGLKEQFDAWRGETNATLPRELNATLRPYQERGYSWMCKNLEMGFGCILADDMGLGKTLQVIAFLLKMKEASAYIRYTICQKKESVWIAQRNGRTKDGLDVTDQGVINMFSLSGGEDRGASLGELNMVPVAISYEWEPCDKLKALELFARESGEPYVKKPGEDLNSILTGITQPKGRVHLAAGKPITEEELRPYNNWSTGDFNRQVAALIEQQITACYRLYPNNYIAAWMLSGKKQGDFTPEEQQTFQKYVESQVKGCPEKVREILLKIYANPVLRTL